MIAEVADSGAALAAVASGIPCVVHSFGRRLPAEAPMGVHAHGPLVALAAEYGVPLAEGDLLAHTDLDICPPSLQAPSTPDRPWVYLTLGTATGDAGVLRTAIAGLAGLGLDVLVATGSVDAAELADVRGRVGVEPFVAQADLFGSATPPSVVIHHGGSGTTLGAAAAGIPQLLVPQGADQSTDARAVTAVGAGAVTEAARLLLADGAAHARALAVEIAAMPSPADVAAQVGDWSQPLM